MGCCGPIFTPLIDKLVAFNKRLKDASETAKLLVYKCQNCGNFYKQRVNIDTGFCCHICKKSYTRRKEILR